MVSVRFNSVRGKYAAQPDEEELEEYIFKVSIPFRGKYAAQPVTVIIMIIIIIVFQSPFGGSMMRNYKTSI